MTIWPSSGQTTTQKFDSENIKDEMSLFLIFGFYIPNFCGSISSVSDSNQTRHAQQMLCQNLKTKHCPYNWISSVSVQDRYYESLIGD